MSGERTNKLEGIDTPRIDRHAARPDRMTELDYLEDEAALAKDSMQNSCRQIGRSVKSSAGRVWNNHPVMVSVTAAGLACLGAALLGRARQRRTTQTIITESDAPRGRSLFSRAGGLIGKALISLLIAKLTSPPTDETAPGVDDLSDTGAAV